LTMEGQNEAYMYSSVAAAIQPIMHKEREWDADKLQKKTISYLSSASKAISGGKTWDQQVADFANKFYEAFWRALGEREWLDDIDLTYAIAAAFQAYAPPNVLQQLQGQDDLFLQTVTRESANAWDSCRYYSWGWQALKKVVTSKQAQKKVRDALDTAREEVYNQTPPTSEAFIQGWIQGTVDQMAKAGGNPKQSLSEADATRLFDTMVQEGGGLPLQLVKMSGHTPPRGWPEIPSAVRAAYANYPDVAPAGNAWNGKGGGGYSPMSAAPSWGMGMGMGMGMGYAPY